MSDKLQTVFEPPDFSGYLRKKGGKIKAYRRRWFELRGQNMYYFKAQNQKRPAGVIVLTNARIADDPSKKLSFKIVGDNLSRTYELTAESEADKQNWMSELLKACQKANAKSQNASSPTPQAVKQPATTSPTKGPIKAETLFNNDKKKVSLDDFELLTVIGRGSFGKVMKVRKKDTKKIFAMKILRKDMIIKENMISHTKAEKQILQSIDHPFIVRLHYAFQTPEKLYLVLDFLSGGELFFHLKEETKFDVERAKLYAAQIVLAIEHLHKNDIIYRDLKPENIVLDAKGNICLTDFGLAKTCITNATPTYTFCGTPEYLAPEILKGQGHAKAVDWWSLGVLLYEMLVGLPPFYSENINEMYELILKAPLKFPNFVPSDAQSLLRGLLEREEFKRLGSGPTDAQEIKNHPFFSNIDWNKLYRKEYVMPFIPNIKDDDTKYFDPEFTSEAAKDSFAEVAEDGDDNFNDFDHDGDD
jgi:serine/threonine protein kinase